jgi:hypothetical protein
MVKRKKLEKQYNFFEGHVKISEKQSKLTAQEVMKRKKEEIEELER